MSISKKHANFRKVMAAILSIVMLLVQLPMNVFAETFEETVPEVDVVEPEVAPVPGGETAQLTLGTGVVVTTATTLTFTPDVSGVYCFYSGEALDCDPFATLYDADHNELGYNDDGGGELQFEMHLALTAGVTYYLEAGAYSDHFQYTVTVEESNLAGIEIVSCPAFETIQYDIQNGSWMTVYDGKIVDRYFNYHMPYEVLSNIVIKVTYKDGTSKEIGYEDENGHFSGIYFEWDFYQNPWTVGSDNPFYINYKGMKAVGSATVTASPVAHMELVSIDNVEFVECDESNGYWSNYYYDIELKEPYFTYFPNEQSIVLSVTYTDGTVREVQAYSEEAGWAGISTYSDQYLDPWTLGENTFEIWYQGACITTTATVIESPVESIEVISGGDFAYTEFDSKYGYWTSSSVGEFFYYYPHQFVNNLVVKVTYKDGTTEEITTTDGITSNHTQWEQPWTVDGNNLVTISYKGASIQVPVTIKPGLVERIEVEDVVVTAGTNGEFYSFTDSTTAGVWYRYITEPSAITVYLTDGRVLKGDSHEIYQQLGAWVSFIADQEQSYYNQWGVGEYTVTASLLGRTTEFRYIIEESDVAEIFVEDVSVNEGEDGYWDSGYWENGQWTEREWFCYSFLNQEVTVTLKDGQVLSGTLSYLGEELGLATYFITDQCGRNPWEAGTTHTAVVYVGGTTCEVSVSIRENNVESIRVIDTQNFVYYENDPSTGSWEGDLFIYSVWELASRVTLLVTYKDGSTEEVSYYDEHGNYTGIQFSSNQYQDPWTIGGDNPLTIRYMGKSDTISAVIGNTPIASIVVEPLTYSVGLGGWWQYYWHYNENMEYVQDRYYYYPVEPQKITVTCTNGTVISGTRDEIEKQTGSSIGFSDDQSFDNPWGVGTHMATCTFMGVSVEFAVIIEESPVKSIVIEPITLAEGVDGAWYSNRYEQDGEWVMEHYYHYYVEPQIVTIIYRDGKVISGTPYEIEEQTGYRLEILADQDYDNPWGAGVHTVDCTFMGAVGEYEVYITESPVQSVQADPVTVTEGTNGYWTWDYIYDENGNQIEAEYFVYDVYPETITVTYKDGTVVSGSRDEIAEQTGYWLEVFSDQFYYNQWDIGTYTATCSFMGVSAEFEVTITASPIASIEVEPVTMIEGTNGWWNDGYYSDEEGENYYRYYYYNVNPERITITYLDGITISGDRDEIEKLIGYYPEISSNQGYRNPWGVGTYVATCTVMGVSVEYEVNITETPIDHIDIEPVTLTEGVDGWWRFYEYVDEDGYYVEDRYFYYDPDPRMIVVTFKDGTVYSGDREQIGDQIGYYPELYTDQDSDNQWGVGTYTATCFLMGASVEYEVNVTNFPITSVEVKPYTLEQGMNGWWSSYSYEEDGVYKEGIYYEYNIPWDELSVTVTMQDGTVVTGNVYEIQEQLGCAVNVYSNQSPDNPWGAGSHTAIIEVMGHETEFEVIVNEAPIESIVVDPITIIEGTHGWWYSYSYIEDDKWIEGEYFYYDVDPQTITVTYKDGTVVSGNRYELEKLTGYNSSTHVLQGSDNQWGVGTHTMWFGIAGVVMEIEVIIAETNIESITILPLIHVEGEDGWMNDSYYDEEKDTWVSCEWREYDFTPDIILVTFTDGSTFAGDYSDFNQLGYAMKLYCDQSGYNPWGVGAHNVYLEGVGFSCEYTVEIVERVESEEFAYGVLSDGTAVILAYYGDTDVLVIPETIDGYEVSVIGRYAFNEYRTFYGTAVYIPETVKWIEEGAFYGCSSLNRVMLHSNLAAIGSYAFDYCYSLEMVQFYGDPQLAEEIFILEDNEYFTNAGWEFIEECDEHVYDDACDVDCNVCFMLRDAEHPYDWIVDYEGTCVEDGYQHEECPLCGATRNHETIIPAIGKHGNTYWQNIMKPTCGNEGYSGDLYCEVCDSIVEEGRWIEPTGEHVNTELRGQYDATCGSEGYTGDLFCHDCERYVEWGEYIPATGEHINTELFDQYDATCGDEGYTGDLFCHDCGWYVEWGKPIPATGEHENLNWHEGYDATCGEDGYTGDLRCDDCDTVIEGGEIIPATGKHENVERINKEDATCGGKGYTGDLYCYDCYTYIEYGEYLPQTPHMSITLTNAYAATCGSDGYTGDLYCRDCRTVVEYGETIPATGNHVYDDSYDADCNDCGAVREVEAVMPELSLSGGTAYQGDTIRVDVSISGNTGFAGLQFGLIYDSNYLTLSDVETHMPDFFTTVNNSIVFDALENYVQDGVIATLVFEVAEDTPVGDYGIQLRFMSASTDDFQIVKMTDASATVSVESAVLGDVNGDGYVNTVDLVMLRKYLASMDPETKISDIVVHKGADGNQDGVIDTIDLTFVRQYLASMTAG